MADSIVDPGEFLKADSASPNSKRKRELEDNPEEGRKRSIASATPLISTDAPNLSFIESAVEAAAAAANNNLNNTNNNSITNIANAATVAALSALQHATHTSEAPEQSPVTVTADHTPTHTHVVAQQPQVPQHQAIVTQLVQHPHAPHQHRDSPTDPSDPANASTTAAAALGTMYPTLHVPTPTEQQFVTPAPQQPDAHVSVAPQPQTVPVITPTTQHQVSHQPTHPSPYQDIDTMELARSHEMSLGHRKPAVGTPEWHKQRKDNHKEVERRRRETINEGINELAKIVPQCEKNKGSILQKAVQFIQQLKANEASNIEKWTLEKLLTEQAIGELSQSNEKLKAECERLYRELETYKRLCQSAGLEIPGKQSETTVPTTSA